MKYIALLLIAFSFQVSADALSIVKEYVELDWNGARLSSLGYDEISHLSNWEEEPGWDVAYSVSSYQIKLAKDDKVLVIYQQHGACFEALSATPSEHRVVFILDEASKKIIKPVIAPRVNSELMCKKYKCCVPSM